MKRRTLVLLVALAALFPLGAAGAKLAWPSMGEQLRADAVVPHSALEALIAANQDFSILRPEEARDQIGVPLWLRVLWRRAHPEDVYSGADPTGGYPLLLKEVHEWMLLHQDLVPGPPERSSPPELDEDALGKATAAGSDRRISGAQSTLRSESDIRVNYWNPQKIVAAANDLSSGGQAELYSTDGGVTWGQTTLPVQPGDAFQADPTVDWTSDGTAWSVTIGINTSFGVYQLQAYKSTDNGATWTLDGIASGSQVKTDKEILWADHSATSPFKDTLYVIWHNSGLGYMNRRTPGPGGAWQTPIQVGGAETTGTPTGSDVKTNAFGDVFGFWADTGSRHLFVAKSTNGGASYGTPVPFDYTSDLFNIGVPAMNSRRALIYVSGGAYRTASKNLVYASWTDLTGTANCNQPVYEPGSNVASPCKSRIWFARSTNGGATWSAPVMINNQASLNDQFNQWMVVDETNGALGIMYYDTVADPRRKQVDVWFQSSHDDGATWSPATKVTSAQTDETAPTADPSNQFGDYNGLSGIAGQFFPSWTDRRSNASEEIWTAKVSDAVCTSPGAPAVGTAAAVGPNQIRTTWGNGAPAAALFNVYRAAGTCAAPGAFARVGSGVAGSPYQDTTVSGGSTYAYQVRGTDASGLCESAPSACVQATATGACRTPPSFAGVASVTNTAATACGVALSWPPATSACGGAITYNVYLSSDPNFGPLYVNLVASHVTGTSYLNLLPPEANGFPFYYRVRAVDSANGLEESNEVTRGATPTGPASNLLTETFEGPGGFDNPGWTHSVNAGSLSSDWVWSTDQSHSSAHSWFSPSAGVIAQKSLVSPTFTPQAGTLLSFWHTYSFDDGAGCYDAGILQVSTDGTFYSTLPDAAFRWGIFNGSIVFGSNGYAPSRAWCNGTIGPMRFVQADLSAYAGTPIKLRWIESDDNVIGFTGWYVDDVTIATAAACKANGLLSDSFENGTLGAWSGTVP